MSDERAPGVRRLEALVERVAPRDPARWEARPALKRGRQVSASRARQLRSTVNQLGVAVGHEGMPENCGRSVRALLSPEAVDAFLDLAWSGVFRPASKQALVGRALSWSSIATLRDCVKILGEEAGIAVVVPAVWRQRLDLAPVPSVAQLEALYGRIVAMSRAAPVDALMARALACMGVVLDTRMSSGDLVSRRLEHVQLEGGDRWMVAQWHRQNAAHLPVLEEQVPLREGTVLALQRWLPFREALVGGLQGSDHGRLWVTVQATERLSGDVWKTYEAGMPLGARGLRDGFARGMERLNDALAGLWKGPGPWEGLPTRVEQLRRGVEWAQEQQATR